MARGMLNVTWGKPGYILDAQWAKYEGMEPDDWNVGVDSREIEKLKTREEGTNLTDFDGRKFHIKDKPLKGSNISGRGVAVLKNVKLSDFDMSQAARQRYEGTKKSDAQRLPTSLSEDPEVAVEDSALFKVGEGRYINSVDPWKPVDLDREAKDQPLTDGSNFVKFYQMALANYIQDENKYKGGEQVLAEEIKKSLERAPRPPSPENATEQGWLDIFNEFLARPKDWEKTASALKSGLKATGEAIKTGIEVAKEVKEGAEYVYTGAISAANRIFG